jgi:polyadenylation factor subunit 2
MMRDVCLLKGHEKDVSTLTWHPIHHNLLSTGGSDGSIYHYLLDEPNTPPGAPASISPYDSPDPSNTAAQSLYPAHKVQHAHDFAVWSLCWHPLGHILASGSNDRVTRFWTRPRPGETDYVNDRYHLGEAAAEAQGTFDRRGARREMREAEEQELEDEEGGLVDQTMPAKPSLPGLPGLAQTADKPTSFAPTMDLPPVLPIPPPPPNFVGMDPQRFAQMVAEGKIIPPPPPPGQPFAPPPPGFDFSKLPPEILAKFPGGVPPPGFIPPPPPQLIGGLPIPPPPPSVGLPGMDLNSALSVRKRGPLPSQQESLIEEQKKGNYRTAR